MKTKQLVLLALTQSKDEPLVNLFKSSDKEEVQKLITEYVKTLMAIHRHLDELDDNQRDCSITILKKN